MLSKRPQKIAAQDGIFQYHMLMIFRLFNRLRIKQSKHIEACRSLILLIERFQLLPVHREGDRISFIERFHLLPVHIEGDIISFITQDDMTYRYPHARSESL